MAWQYFPYKTDQSTPDALPRDFVAGTVCSGISPLREGVADFIPKPPTRLLLHLVRPVHIDT